MKSILWAVLLAVALLTCQPVKAWGAYALVANVGAGSSSTTDVTTGAINTTGANLVVACVINYEPDSATLADSKSNTWTPRTIQSSAATEVQLYYFAGGTVGTNHTFTATCSGTCYPVIVVAAFSGAHATPYDQENGANTGSDTSVQTGSVTPSENNELLFSCLSGNDTGSLTINSGFTITDDVPYEGGQHFTGGGAYLIQGTASAVNPTWSWVNTTDVAVSIATFKSSGGGAVPRFGLMGVGG
jgi:hypothetical protein